MNWSNESVLEFIELLQGEPSIWNHNSRENKNRNSVSDAWVRLKDNFSVSCSVQELKKKRNILLTQYRESLKKIKESTESGAEEIYRPSWFAFEAFHSYMGDVYEHNYRPTISTETEENADERSLSRETYSMESNLERPLFVESNAERSMSRDSNSRSESDTFPVLKRQRGEKELLNAKINKEFSSIKNRPNSRENEKEPDECDLYSQLLAKKLKSLDVCDRLVLMNKIDNIVFKYIMDVRKQSCLDRSENFPSMNQTQLVVDRKPFDLPVPLIL